MLRIKQMEALVHPTRRNYAEWARASPLSALGHFHAHFEEVESPGPQGERFSHSVRFVQRPVDSSAWVAMISQQEEAGGHRERAFAIDHDFSRSLSGKCRFRRRAQKIKEQ